MRGHDTLKHARGTKSNQKATMSPPGEQEEVCRTPAFTAEVHEVEAMTLGTPCKIQLLTQLFSAGVRKGRLIYCISFVEVGDFLVYVAHSQDEMDLLRLKVHHCFQMVSSYKFSHL